MLEFVESIEQIDRDIKDVKKLKNFSGELLFTKDYAGLCWICETELNTSSQDPAVLDRCRF